MLPAMQKAGTFDFQTICSARGVSAKSIGEQMGFANIATDEQLVLEALDDSHSAFEQLIEQYQYRVMRTIASIIANEQAAQDVAQEALVR